MEKLIAENQVSYNAIFYSAYKALAIFKLLCESPKTLDEILSKLASLPFHRSNMSKDNLRTYINTFSDIGFTVEKTLTGKNHREYTYKIIEHPYVPKINSTQIERYFEIYDLIMYNTSFEHYFEVDLLTRKFDIILRNPEFSEAYLKHSLIKNFSPEFLKELCEICRDKSVVTILYKSPRSNDKEIKIAATSMMIRNYKSYLCGYGYEYGHDGIFLLDRIIKIISVEPAETAKIPASRYKTVTVELYDDSIKLEDNEELIDSKNGTRLIKINSNNSVLLLQRLLKLENKAKIIEPENYKKNFVNILKAMKEVNSGF